MYIRVIFMRLSCYENDNLNRFVCSHINCSKCPFDDVGCSYSHMAYERFEGYIYENGGYVKIKDSLFHYIMSHREYFEECKHKNPDEFAVLRKYFMGGATLG